MEKVIWKMGMTSDFLKSLPEEQLRNELIDLGYEEEMLSGLDYDSLVELVSSDSFMDGFRNEDIEDFENNISPMIEKQSLNGRVIVSSDTTTFDVYGNELLDEWPGVNISIIDDGQGLAITRGPSEKVYKLYIIPEDGRELVTFCQECLPGFIDYWVEEYVENEDLDEDGAYQTVLNDLPDLLSDSIDIEDYIDTDALVKYGIRVKNLLHESLGDDKTDFNKLDEYLNKPLDEDLNNDVYNALADVAFEYEVNKEEPVYKEDFEEAEEYFNDKFFADHDIDESLNESISLTQPDRDLLASEIERIKKQPIEKLYDIDLLTTELSDGSMEESYPIVTKLIISFLKEMSALTNEELANKDQINIWWVDGDLFSGPDWNALFGGAESLINGKKRILWKGFFNPYSTIEDPAADEILESKNKSLEEDLSPDIKEQIKEICDEMISNIDTEDLEYIIEEEPFSEDGILSNDNLAELCDDADGVISRLSEIANFAIRYIKSKI